MGFISNILGEVAGGKLQTSAMKGANQAEKTGDASGYGQTGIVGTILKMYLGNAVGGAMGGEAGGGASGLEGAANGMSNVTSNLGFGDAATSPTAAASKGGVMGEAGDFLQNRIENSSGEHGKPQQQTLMNMMTQPQDGMQGLMSQLPGWNQPGQQQDASSLMRGISDYFGQNQQRRY